MLISSNSSPSSSGWTDSRSSFGTGRKFLSVLIRARGVPIEEGGDPVYKPVRAIRSRSDLEVKYYQMMINPCLLPRQI